MIAFRRFASHAETLIGCDGEGLDRDWLEILWLQTGADATRALNFLLDTLVDCCSARALEDTFGVEEQIRRSRYWRATTRFGLASVQQARETEISARILRRCRGWISATQWSMMSRSASPMKRALASRGYGLGTN